MSPKDNDLGSLPQGSRFHPARKCHPGSQSEVLPRQPVQHASPSLSDTNRVDSRSSPKDSDASRSLPCASRVDAPTHASNARANPRVACANALFSRARAQDSVASPEDSVASAQDSLASAQFPRTSRADGPAHRSNPRTYPACRFASPVFSSASAAGSRGHRRSAHAGSTRCKRGSFVFVGS
jgi:hypothetical protein